jgi:uroporphyrinogen-III synthase
VADSGLVPVVMPAYRFDAVAPGAQVDTFARAPGRKLIVFTSKRAVEFGLRQLSGSLLAQAAIAAIGPATAAALAANGHPVSLVPEGGYTSEHLLAHPGLAVDPGAAMLVAAPGGRSALSQGLDTLGWRVFTAYVYQREDLAPPPDEVHKLLAASGVISVWTSQNAMDALMRDLPADAWRKVCDGVAVVISDRLGLALQARGVARVVAATGPGNAQLLQRVLQLI